MSKLKVSFSHLIKACFVPRRAKKQYLYVLAFFKTLKDVPFTEKLNEDKVLKYWVGQSTPEIISIADRLFEDEKYMEVYEILNRIRFTRDTEVLWRIARALYNMSLEPGLKNDVKSEMVEEGYNMLQLAFSVGDESADVHKWMAIILHTRHESVDLEYSVKHSPIVRDHLIKACELNPQDFTVHYMLGKWCFEMCELNWFQRLIAKYFIASEPPKSTYPEAYRYLSRAEELRPRSFIPNLYLLGKVCVRLELFYQARYYLNLAINLQPRDKCEKCCVSKATHLLSKLDRYDLGGNLLFYDNYPFGDM